MIKIFKSFTLTIFVTLCGCGISTPPLPPIDKESFSYEEIMKRQEQLEKEMQEMAADQ